MAELVQVGATIQCPHGGQASIVPTNARVKAGGAFVALQADTTTIAGCAFTLPNGTPQPCLMVQWLSGALRVKVGGQPVLTKSSNGLCQGAAPQGSASIVSTQMQVKGQ